MEEYISTSKSQIVHFDDEVNQNLEFLALNLTNLAVMLSHLKKDGILLAEDMAIIQSETTSLSRNFKLLVCLQRKEWPRVKSDFLKILRETYNDDCADIIENFRFEPLSTKNGSSSFINGQSINPDDELNQNMEYLMQNMFYLEDILMYLLQDGIISIEEMEIIKSEKTHESRNFKLLEFLKKKGWSRVKNNFLNTLRETYNDHCADKIESTQIAEKVSRNNSVVDLEPSEVDDEELNRNFDYLAHHMSNLTLMLIRLLQDKLVTIPEMDMIEGENIPGDRNFKLLECLRRRGWSNVKNKFLEILRQTGNAHCADHIDQYESPDSVS